MEEAVVMGSPGSGSCMRSSFADLIGSEQKRTKYIRRAVTERLLDLCDDKGYTVNKLSKLSGVTQSTVNDIVNGKSENIGIITLYKLCIGFGISLEEFFADELFRY